MPHNNETSVFCTTGLVITEIWNIGSTTTRRAEPLYGKADITAENVFQTGLKVVPDDQPERHANILGWPAEKSQQKQMAMELAAVAQYHNFREQT